VGAVLPACQAGFFGIGHTGAGRGLEYKARRGRVTDCHLSATTPTKQNGCQAAKSQCLTLTLLFRYHVTVKENRPSGQKKPIYEQKAPMWSKNANLWLKTTTLTLK
tara:strand:+ start:891 stop:1208 length:318 start_codon:yes stop_codon:yes gene_type:complete